MNTKDNPGSSLPINLYLTEQLTSEQFDFVKIKDLQGETAVTPREGEGEERSSDLFQSSGDIVYLVPDGRPPSKMKLYVLTQALSVVPKIATAMYLIR